MTSSPSIRDASPVPNFIRHIVAEDVRTNKHGGRVATRFPPGPNGYMHIGHAKAISISYGLAQQYRGTFNLRFDDTNPDADDAEYIQSIQDDMRWLGFDWHDNLYFASDYFPYMYECAERLLKAGKAYICGLSEQEIRQYRGTFTEPGRPSPYRDRSVEENLDLFRRMRDGEFPDGTHVLRGKIDMASSNMVMRDPLFYRIRHVAHHRTGDQWKIYPLYDFAHCISDSIENITHSICSLEFDNNRELYDWILAELGEGNRPHQYEYARLSLTYTILSKRKLLQLVEGRFVDGWNDPRMPTGAGMRRRGYPAAAIRDFCERIGVTRDISTIDYAQLEFCVRAELNATAPRAMAVLNPLKIVIENYPQDTVEMLDCPYYPEDGLEHPAPARRTVPFAREIYIERDDFMKSPAPDFFRLAVGREVRLRHSYIIKCEQVVEDADGNVQMLRCTYDPNTLNAHPVGRKVKGIVHWVSAAHAVPARLRLYDRLFAVEKPGSEDAPLEQLLNLASLREVTARLEPAIAANPAPVFQFERVGYFARDAAHSTPDIAVFNRTVSLRDSRPKDQV
jgi:glutaminyl-tRNA synthetase